MFGKGGKGWFGLSVFGKAPEPEVVSCTLSGGGSRAGFQLGALEYLYQHDEGFRPTIFCGTSAGSILAGTLAQGRTPDEQQTYLRRVRAIWDGMRTSDDMFTPRAWFATFERNATGLLEVMRPLRQEPEKPKVPMIRWASIPFLSRAQQTADAQDGQQEPPADLDPIELALLPEEEAPSEWSLSSLGAVASALSRVKLGEINSIAHGLEHARSMYRIGPVLAQLLDPQVFSPQRVMASGMKLRLAMVSLETGKLRYMTEEGRLVGREDEPVDDTQYDLAVGVLASCSIPAVFQPVPLDDENYVDGGTRENLPAELTIGHLGAARNYVISSQAIGASPRPSMADADIFTLAMRAVEILIDEAGRDELAYAHSTDSPVIYPAFSVHDPMTVHPGLIAINADYGWLRAAEVHHDMDAEDIIRHERIIKLRMLALRLEQEYLALPSPTAQDLAHLRQDKLELRQLVSEARGLMPPGADTWWQRWERHVDEPGIAPPWLN